MVCTEKLGLVGFFQLSLSDLKHGLNSCWSVGLPGAAEALSAGPWQVE